MTINVSAAIHAKVCVRLMLLRLSEMPGMIIDNREVEYRVVPNVGMCDRLHSRRGLYRASTHGFQYN